MVYCLACGYKAQVPTYQIVEKKYHTKGKIFCPHCGGKVRPVEKLVLKS